MKIRERSVDMKAISVTVFLWAVAGTVISFIVFMVVLTGLVLAAVDILIAFIFVFLFWAILVYVLTGEFPIRLMWIIPKKK
jgi:hypothetical protein